MTEDDFYYKYNPIHYTNKVSRKYYSQLDSTLYMRTELLLTVALPLVHYGVSICTGFFYGKIVPVPFSLFICTGDYPGPACFTLPIEVQIITAAITASTTRSC